MIDADRYWAASSLSIGNSLSVPASPKKPTSGVTAERLDGGCLLYGLPATGLEQFRVTFRNTRLCGFACVHKREFPFGEAPSTFIR